MWLFEGGNWDDLRLRKLCCASGSLFAARDGPQPVPCCWSLMLTSLRNGGGRHGRTDRHLLAWSQPAISCGWGSLASSPPVGSSHWRTACKQPDTPRLRSIQPALWPGLWCLLRWLLPAGSAHRVPVQRQVLPASGRSPVARGRLERSPTLSLGLCSSRNSAQARRSTASPRNSSSSWLVPSGLRWCGLAQLRGSPTLSFPIHQRTTEACEEELGAPHARS